MKRSPLSWLPVLLHLLVPVAANAQDPAFQWAAGPQVPTGHSVAYGLAMDASGSTLVCGMFTDTLTFSTGTIRATGNTVPSNADVFLAKYSPTGAVLWARHGGNSTLGSLEAGYDVDVDPARNVYMTGEYGGATPTSFGGIQIAASGGGAFAVKYDPDGNVQWATSLTSAAYGISLATSGSSHVYVVVGAGATEIKKLNAATGAVVATWSFANLQADPDMRISVDAAGDVIFSGSFFATVDFDPGAGVTTLVGDVPGDGFIAKYDPDGALLWVRQLSGASGGMENIRSHAVTAGGDIFFSGGMDGPATIDTVSAESGTAVGKLDAAGRALWMRNPTSEFFGTPLSVGVERIGADGTGDYYITGVGFAGGGTIGSYTIPSVPHMHVVRYGADGAVGYAKFAPVASGYILPRAFAVHGPDLFHVAGEMSDETTFDAVVLPDVNGGTRQAPFIAAVGDVTSPVLASLATVEASPDRVRLTWHVAGLEGAAWVERRRGEDAWSTIGMASADGGGFVVFEDRDIEAGERLTYRLRWSEGGVEIHSDPVALVVPGRVEGLSLAAAPNPANRMVDALIGVPAPGDLALELHDILGREVMTQRLRADAAGRMIVRLGTADLPAGLYWLSIRQGGRSARTRISVVR